ncbi:MAG: LysM peptidoglycan-binding domain-containing protein [Chloroflexi bacterium]|nr:LysM peptidoglycan-binding domain-containing protein [Chloroflexota bacterium]
MDANPDATKVIVPSNLCGSIYTAPTYPTYPTYPSYPGSYPYQPYQPYYQPYQQQPQFQPIYQPASYYPPTGGRVHVVQPGDTLYSISMHYGVSMQSIAAANGIYDYSTIYIGQQLIIP